MWSLYQLQAPDWPVPLIDRIASTENINSKARIVRVPDQYWPLLEAPTGRQPDRAANGEMIHHRPQRPNAGTPTLHHAYYRDLIDTSY